MDPEGSATAPAHTSPPVDRQRLEALRYAVNEESAQYIAIMRVFTTGLAGLLSDQSAVDVRTALAEQGLAIDLDTVDARLSYLVEHGNIARSPRETEARTLADYLRNRARYQLTQRGELVHRQVEELLGHSESAREVSSQMLGGILAWPPSSSRGWPTWTAPSPPWDGTRSPATSLCPTLRSASRARSRQTGSS